MIDFKLMEDKYQEVDDGPDLNEFYDPRLVAIYDTANPVAEYERFYLDLASKLSASSIIDIGCGTGLLTCELAKRGHRLIGVEPSKAMLEVARRRACGARVEWIEGDVLGLDELQADLAIMTGHVAQFFLDDAGWHSTLVAIRKALRPGGHIAFESRNPLVQPWANKMIKDHVDWPAQTSRRRVDDSMAGRIEWWTEILEIEDDRVRTAIHYLFTRSGEVLVSNNELRFRTRAELSRSLSDAGFSVESVFGDWDSRPADVASRELIFVAAS
ncbi:MAG TPA: class I SAM-dependent methyltransferase [Rubrobacter sp.]|nr:class I SAM-dependent methyltransferase [Rubrobacter sp.]